MRIALVHDSILALDAIKKIILTDDRNIVAWTASDGEEALRKVLLDKPDLILFGLSASDKKALKALEKIMKKSPLPVLLVTESISANAGMVFEAMSYGALDAIVFTLTPGYIGTEGNELLKKIGTILKLTGNSGKSTTASVSGNFNNNNDNFASILAIGSSTGGPKVLIKIIKELPTDFNMAVVIVQHIDTEFSLGFIDWIEQYSQLPVEAAKEGEIPRKGKIYVSKTEKHLSIKKDRKFAYTDEPITEPFIPSVNHFFNSLANNWGKTGIAALLSGMGSDGGKALALLKMNGWHTIVQDESTSTVFGMPKAAIENNAATIVLPDYLIGSEILRISKNFD